MEKVHLVVASDTRVPIVEMSISVNDATSKNYSATKIKFDIATSETSNTDRLP